MDFIDDYCDVFDNEDENKFVYTDIHEKFKEHVRYYPASIFIFVLFSKCLFDLLFYATTSYYLYALMANR